MSPLFACCLCFWLEIVGPAFISSLYAEEKSRFQFWCTHFVVLENIVHNMVSTAMANTRFQVELQGKTE